MNDYYDIPKDRINKPYRALPSGKVSARAACLFGVVLIVAACLSKLCRLSQQASIITLFRGHHWRGIYNVLLQYISLSKTVLTAAISVLPLFFVTTTLAYPSVYLFITKQIAGLFFLLHH